MTCARMDQPIEEHFRAEIAGDLDFGALQQQLAA